MPIKTYDQLIASFPDNVTRDISPSDMRTLVESTMRVYGGVELTGDKAVSLSTTPTLLTFDQAEPGFNVTTNPGAGSLTVPTNGAGRYVLRIVIPKMVTSSNNVEVIGQLYIDGSPVPGTITEQLENNKEISITISIEPDLTDGMVLTLFWSLSSGSATVTFGERTTFGIRRVG